MELVEDMYLILVLVEVLGMVEEEGMDTIMAILLKGVLHMGMLICLVSLVVVVEITV